LYFFILSFFFVRVDTVRKFPVKSGVVMSDISAPL
jgi:hypothetical protein